MILSIIMIASQMTIVSAETSANISATVQNKSGTSISIAAGEEFTVVLHNNKMTVESFIGGIQFNGDCISVKTIEGCRSGRTGVYLKRNDSADYVSLEAEKAQDGNAVGFYYTGSTNVTYASQDFIKITFTAKKVGNANISLYEKSSGTNAVDIDPIAVGWSVNVTESGEVNPNAKMHLTASTNSNSVKVGEEVDIILSTSAMKVTSFFGGLEFDNTMFDYIGIAGFVSGRSGAYLQKDSGDYSAVQVQLGKTQDVVGIMLTGTKDNQYVAGNLVRIKLRATKSGTASFTLYEDSDGYDRYAEDDVDAGISIVVTGKTASNLTASSSSTSVAVGNTFTVTVGLDSAWLSTITGGINFNKDVVTVTKIEGARPTEKGVYLVDADGKYTQMSTSVGNTGDNVGFVLTGTSVKSYKTQDFLKVTFKVFAVGDAGISLYENSSGYDGYKADPISVGFTVTTKDRTVINNDPFESISAQTYTGVALTPALVLKSSYAEIGDSYSATYSNNVNPGTASIQIVFNGDYSGTISKTFTIDRATISSATLSQTSYTKTGSAITPIPSVKGSNGKTLTVNTDFTVEYSNNIEAGTATITVTGINNYQGSKQVDFTITDSGSGSGGGGGGSGGGGSSDEPEPEDNPGEPTVDITVTSDDVELSGGVLNASISNTQVEAIVSAIGEDTEIVVIAVGADSGAKVDESHLMVPAKILDTVNSANSAIEISLPTGDIALSAEAVSQAVKQSDGKPITINISRNNNSASINVEYNVTVTCSSGTIITNFGGGELTLVLPIPVGLKAGEGISVLYINGSYAFDMNASVENGKAVFKTNHLSKYAVMSTTESNNRLAKSVKKSTVGKLTVKAQKGKKMKLTWNTGKGNTPEGYVVYRSTKAKSGFKKIATVKGDKKTYTVKTGLKKGKKYYYKVRGYVTIADQKVYTKYSSVKNAKCK